MGENNFVRDFKAFIMKGNVVDMAVGVIIGGAFGKIISSLVDDIIMPPIGYLIHGVSFTELKLTLGSGAHTANIAYGNFLQTLLNFIIIAFCIFLMIKAVARLSAKKEEKPAAPPVPTKEEELLTEIRDLLKEGNNK